MASFLRNLQIVENCWFEKESVKVRKLGFFRLWGLWIALCLFLVVVVPPLITWQVTSPKAYGRGISVTGQFMSAEIGGTITGPGVDPRDHARTRYSLVVSEDEFNRFGEYDDLLAQTYRGSGDGQVPTVLFQTTGIWCGELPPSGVAVKIKSPTGFTRRVSITDLETGRIYKPEKDEGQASCLFSPFIP